MGMKTMRHLFIVNPAAGDGKHTAELSDRISRAVLNWDANADFEIYLTKAPMDAVRKIEEEAQSGDALRVYACGGDGTLNECVCGAAEKPNVAVTHFPCGTGNDFIKAFGEERERFFALEELLCGEERAIDVIRIGDRYSVNICSVGIDARIGCNVHKYSRIPVIGGAAGYVISTAVELIKGIKRPIRAIVNEQVFEGDKTLICVCNGTSYGGIFNPMPDARVDDGLLDILVVKGVSRLAFAKLVGRYAKGRFRELSKLCDYVRVQSIRIEAPEELLVNVDGEAMRDSTLEMTVVPRGLNFIFPAKMAYFENESKEFEEIKR